MSLDGRPLPIVLGPGRVGDRASLPLQVPLSTESTLPLAKSWMGWVDLEPYTYTPLLLGQLDEDGVPLGLR